MSIFHATIWPGDKFLLTFRLDITNVKKIGHIGSICLSIKPFIEIYPHIYANRFPDTTRLNHWIEIKDLSKNAVHTYSWIAECSCSYGLFLQCWVFKISKHNFFLLQKVPIVLRLVDGSKILPVQKFDVDTLIEYDWQKACLDSH